MPGGTGKWDPETPQTDSIEKTGRSELGSKYKSPDFPSILLKLLTSKTLKHEPFQQDCVRSLGRCIGFIRLMPGREGRSHAQL